MSAGAAFFENISEVCYAPYGRSAPAKARAVQQTRDAALSLNQIVEADIGPRLVLFHQESLAASAPERRPSRDDIERLAMLVIGTDEAATVAHFESVCAQHSYSTVLAHFVAPAAQLLGELWKQDVCDFFEVTVGVGRLQAFMDRLATPEPISAGEARRRILLIALPGETHFLGVRMVAKMLEATGWDVTLEEQRSVEHNARTVAKDWFGVVGITVNVAARAELAARTVAIVRSASLNRRVGVMAGGSALIENPDLALQIGAEAVGFDAPTAALLASHLLMRQAAAA